MTAHLYIEERFNITISRFGFPLGPVSVLK